MEAHGAIHGNTLTIQWTAIKLAVKYLVTVEQCNDTSTCEQVFNQDVFNTTFLEVTSAEKFGPCTFYTLKVNS